MDERWEVLLAFPNYMISNLGRIKNLDDHVMSLNVNNTGIVYVGLTQGGTHYKRAVALLVANTFLPSPESDAFDTPIHLDGDRKNNRADNLVWRPRAFAREYQRQFGAKQRSLPQQVEEVKTQRVFKNTWEVATTFGLLHRPLILSILGHTETWPTKQRFSLIYDDINQR